VASAGAAAVSGDILDLHVGPMRRAIAAHRQCYLGRGGGSIVMHGTWFCLQHHPPWCGVVAIGDPVLRQSGYNQQY
jgi:hypothetical protein